MQKRREIDSHYNLLARLCKAALKSEIRCLIDTVNWRKFQVHWHDPLHWSVSRTLPISHASVTLPRYLHQSRLRATCCDMGAFLISFPSWRVCKKARLFWRGDQTFRGSRFVQDRELNRWISSVWATKQKCNQWMCWWKVFISPHVLGIQMEMEWRDAWCIHHPRAERFMLLCHGKW